MSRAAASLFQRMSLKFFADSKQRRFKRHQRRNSHTIVEDRIVTVADIILEQRLLLSAVTIAADVIDPTAVLITAVDETNATADVLTVNNGIRVESTGGSVNLNAGDNLDLGVGSTIAAVTTVNLNLDKSDADAGFGSVATLQNVFDGTLVNITGCPD